MLVVDRDEFVFGDEPLAPLLSVVPDEVESVRFPTAEAVWGPGDDIDEAFGCTHFRTGWTNKRLWGLLGPVIYGPTARALQRGLMGHEVGKHLVRTGRAPMHVTAHVASRDGVTLKQPAARFAPGLSRYFLGHFDAISRSRWERKWQFRLESDIVAAAMTKRRKRQMRLAAAALAAGRTRQVFRRFYGLGPVQVQVLSWLGLAFRRTDVFADARASMAAPAPAPSPQWADGQS